jgi:fumarylacetoacetase
MTAINASLDTHAMGSTTTTSFVESANVPGSNFPLQNLPFCVYRPCSSGVPFRIGVGIGSLLLDLRQAARIGLLQGLSAEQIEACQHSQLNSLFNLGRASMVALREHLTALLRSDSMDIETVKPLLMEQSQVEFDVPFAIGDYTDFFASVNHATNVGKMYRPDTPLLPNFKTQPLAYHGRASSVVMSGDTVVRPRGNYRDGHGGELKFGPTNRLDFEVEIGVYIGRGNPRNTSIALDEAEDHIAGVCVVNDWSARDIQSWETQPLGPFLGKNFATTVSPWVVTLDALEPYRQPAVSEAQGEAALSDYLRSPRNQVKGGLAIQIETYLQTPAMREVGAPREMITAARFDRDSFWTVGQMVAHHTVNGCNLRTGDLLASGTLSGPTERTEGCLLELTRGGTVPLTLSNGESRRFLEDGDEVTITAFCALETGERIGFGESTGRVLASTPNNLGKEQS